MESWQGSHAATELANRFVVRARIETLRRKVRRRNLIGGLACLTVLLGFAYYAIIYTNPIQRIGSALTVLGAGYLMYQLILGKSHIRPEAGVREHSRRFDLLPF